MGMILKLNPEFLQAKLRIVRRILKRLRRDEDTNNIKYQLSNAPLDSRFGGIII